MQSGRRRGTDDLVKNDTFRTLTTDTQFRGKVKEDMLIRLLEAFVWKNQGMYPSGAHHYRMRSDESTGQMRRRCADGAVTERDGLPFTYVQG